MRRVGDVMGLNVQVNAIPNPRKEKEQHYYNAHYSALLDLGLEPHFMTDDVLAAMLEKILPYKDQIQPHRVMPRVKWNT